MFSYRVILSTQVMHLSTNPQFLIFLQNLEVQRKLSNYKLLKKSGLLPVGLLPSLVPFLLDVNVGCHEKKL